MILFVTIKFAHLVTRISLLTHHIDTMVPSQVHHSDGKHDVVESINIESVPLTEEENKRICCKID
jgi:hypothetical protein